MLLTFYAPLYILFCGLHFVLLSFGEKSFLITSGVYSSDLVQPYLIAQDFLSNPAFVLDWQFSPAIYLFPDTLLAVLFSTLPVPPFFLPVFYAALLLTGYTCSITYCFNSCLKIKRGHPGWLVAALLALSAVVVVYWGGELSRSVYFWLTSSFIHTGALLLTLFSFGLYMRTLETGSRALFLGFSVLILLISFSDLIYIDWFLIPSFFVALIIYLSQKQLDAFRLSERLLMVALCGVILEMLFRQGTHLKSYLSSCNTNVGMFTDLYTRTLSGDLGIALVFVLNVGLLLHAVLVILRSIDIRQLRKMDVLVLYLAASSFSAFSFMALLGIYGCYIDAVMFRYMLPVFVFPLIWVMLGIVRMTYRQRVSHLATLAIAIASLFVVLSPQLTGVRDRFIRNNQTALVECLIEHHLTQGYAGYLDAKRLMFLSGGLVHLMQLDREMNPMRSNYNDVWFSRDRTRRTQLHPNFVLVEQLEAEAVVHKFGSPSAVFECEEQTIYVYEKGLPLFSVTAAGMFFP